MSEEEEREVWAYQWGRVYSCHIFPVIFPSDSYISDGPRDSAADIDDGAALYNEESALMRLLLCPAASRQEAPRLEA